MSSRKKIHSSRKNEIPANTYIEGAGTIDEQPITQTLEVNYMPYAMSVILSRAIPEIDGFKPSHRKILYTMHKMGLQKGKKIKSANIVGRTMAELNPHGDAAIYETMVRLSRGNSTLLHPYIDSKGNFGKSYSRDMSYAASRYTEAKLDDICSELFRDIDKDTVEFIPSYDNKTEEPTLLPATFPSILVNSNIGIAVGMASSICSFNLEEVCDTAIEFLKDSNHDIQSTLRAPDFPNGGIILYDEQELKKIYETGRGGIKIRSRYTVDKLNSLIEVTEIPPTTTVEAIIDKVVELTKIGKIKEISDIRDETDLNGLKITIDFKRGVDPDKLMARLFKMTALQDTFSCNFNILINGTPKVLGVDGIIAEWLDFRKNCIKRRVNYSLTKKQDKLHLLKSLAKILLDIDKAISIIRNTEEENEVVPNLMIGFEIDHLGAEYVAEIKLRNLNREYILKRTSEIESLTGEIEDLKSILGNDKKIDKIIISELKEVSKKYKIARRSMIVYDVSEDDENNNDEPDYGVNIFVTKEGYFKKITAASLRVSSEQKLKDGDEVAAHMECMNNDEILLFTNKSQVYKSKISEFEDVKASVMGDYIPAKLAFEDGEFLKGIVVTKHYNGFIMFFYECGRISRVPLASYQTKTNRRKLIRAYSEKSSLVGLFLCEIETEFVMRSTSGKMLIVSSAQIPEKSTKDNQGIIAMTQKKGNKVEFVKRADELEIPSAHRARSKNLPSVGVLLKPEDDGRQIKFL